VSLYGCKQKFEGVIRSRKSQDRQYKVYTKTNFIIIKVVALPSGMKMANYLPSQSTRVYPHVFCGSLVAQSLNFCVVFRRSFLTRVLWEGK
jgi:hypothetical protein